MNGLAVRPSFLRHYIVHPIEAAFAFATYGVFAVLPVGMASALGGWLARLIGPRLALSQRAVRNLRIGLPDIAPAEVNRIVAGMWEHLGRLAGEYPHLGGFRVGHGPNRIEIVGEEQIERLRRDGGPAILVSGHLGNWEIAPALFMHLGVRADIVYRAANNRLIDWLYRYGRATGSNGQIRKGPTGARQLLAALKQGRNIAMLVDQKMNDGIAVPFFGRPAMTASAAAELALRFHCPLIPVRIERLDGTHFRLTVLPPLAYPNSGDRKQDVLDLMTRINALLESWIRQRPEQWLWLHNRWPDSRE